MIDYKQIVIDTREYCENAIQDLSGLLKTFRRDPIENYVRIQRTEVMIASYKHVLEELNKEPQCKTTDLN